MPQRLQQIEYGHEGPGATLREHQLSVPEVPELQERLEEVPHQARGEGVEVGLLGEQGQAVESQEMGELVETNHGELVFTRKETTSRHEIMALYNTESRH